MSLKHPYQGHYMEAAFLGFLNFALDNFMEQYEAECGPIKLGTSKMDVMIDQATGFDKVEAQRFIDWCVTQFGTPEQIGATS